METLAHGEASATALPSSQLRRDLRRSAAWNAGALIVVWLTALFVVALWVSGGGVDILVGGGPGAVSSAGRLTGLVAADLLLLQVLLLARVPLFERGFGRDGLTRAHRRTGFWSFWLMLAHVALLAVGYAAAAGINPIVQLWTFVRDYPGILLATVGVALITGVTLSSIRRARRRLRYESWHLLHLYAYLGVGLAIPHQLWVGADFTASPAATVYWWTMWAVAVAAVVVFRVVIPLVRSLRVSVRVASVRRDGEGGVTVHVRGHRLDALKVRGGQFFVWRFLDGPGWTRGHPFSLSSAPGDGELTLSARIVGDGTARLARLRPGTRVLIEGPYGKLTGEVRTTHKLLLIGAGAGVAPLVSLLEDESYAPGDATLITRDSSEDAALRAEAIARLVGERGVRHVALNGARARVGSTWLPATHAAWRGVDALRYLAPDLENYDAYICGPVEWMAAVRSDLIAAGLPGSRIHTESFAI